MIAIGVEKMPYPNADDQTENVEFLAAKAHLEAPIEEDPFAEIDAEIKRMEAALRHEPVVQEGEAVEHQEEAPQIEPEVPAADSSTEFDTFNLVEPEAPVATRPVESDTFELLEGREQSGRHETQALDGQEGTESSSDAAPVVEETSGGQVADVPSTVQGAEADDLFADGALAPAGERTPEEEHANTVAAGARLEDIAAQGQAYASDAQVIFDDESKISVEPSASDDGSGTRLISSTPAPAGTDTESFAKVLTSNIDNTELDARARAPELAERVNADGGAGEETELTGNQGSSGIVTPRNLHVGDIVAGTYEITKKLSSGGMGALYAAYDKGLDRNVAIKVILNKNMSLTEEQVERFRAEAHAMAKVTHEGLAQVYGTGVWDGTPYLVMELCHGGDLKKQIQDRGLPSGKADSSTKVKQGDSTKRAFSDNILRALRKAKSMTQSFKRSSVVEQAMVAQEEVPKLAQEPPKDDAWTVQAHTSLIKKLAGALQVVHEKGVVHRDLKPANIMYVDKKRTRPVIIDFGLVPIAKETDGTVLGSPSYMSPEQAQGHAYLDHRTDVYALGAVFYELVTAKLPYQDKDQPSSTIGILERVIMAKATPPIALNNAVDAELSAIIEKMLAKDLLIDRASIRALVQTELESREDYTSLSEEDKEEFMRKRFKEEYDCEYASKKEDTEGTMFRYESAEEVIADIERYETGQPVLAMRYDDETRKAKERAYWEKTHPEEVEAKREEERKAKQWVRNKKIGSIAAAMLTVVLLGNRVNEWLYARSAQSRVNDTHAQVAALSDRVTREGVAQISPDLETTMTQVVSAESLVSEWVVRQGTADAAQGQVQVQGDRQVVDGVRAALRSYNDAKKLLPSYRAAKQESNFAEAYQILFRAYELSHEAVAEEAGSHGLDESRALALVGELDQLRNDAIARRTGYANERITAYGARMKDLYQRRFHRQIPGGEVEFERASAEAQRVLSEELSSPPAVELRYVQVTPAMSADWSRLQRQVLSNAIDLEAALRAIPGVEQGIVLGAREDQHKVWAEELNRARREQRITEDQFREARSRYRDLRQNPQINEEEYLRRGTEMLQRYLTPPAPEPDARRPHVVR